MGSESTWELPSEPAHLDTVSKLPGEKVAPGLVGSDVHSSMAAARTLATMLGCDLRACKRLGLLFISHPTMEVIMPISLTATRAPAPVFKYLQEVSDRTGRMRPATDYPFSPARRAARIRIELQRHLGKS